MREPCFRRQFGDGAVNFLTAQGVEENTREHDALALPLGHALLGEVIDPPVHRLADFGAETAAAERRVFCEKLAVDPGGAWRGYLRLDRQVGSGGERQTLAPISVIIHPSLDDRAWARVACQLEIGEAEVVGAPMIRCWAASLSAGFMMN